MDFELGVGGRGWKQRALAVFGIYTLLIPSNRGLTVFLHLRPSTRRDVSVSGNDSSAGRCRNGTDPARRRIRLLKQLAYLKTRNHLFVNFPQPAASIRQLWEVLARWNLITRPAMLTSVPPRAVIAFFLNHDSLIWCAHPQTHALPNKPLTCTSTKQNATIPSQK